MEVWISMLIGVTQRNIWYGNETVCLQNDKSMRRLQNSTVASELRAMELVPVQVQVEIRRPCPRRGVQCSASVWRIRCANRWDGCSQGRMSRGRGSVMYVSLTPVVKKQWFKQATDLFAAGWKTGWSQEWHGQAMARAASGYENFVKLANENFFREQSRKTWKTKERRKETRDQLGSGRKEYGIKQFN